MRKVTSLNPAFAEWFRAFILSPPDGHSAPTPVFQRQRTKRRKARKLAHRMRCLNRRRG